MLTFEVINELTLKVTCEGKDTLITKMGAFIAGENDGAKNYSFEKMLLGPGGSIGQAVFGQLVRKVAGENIPLMKANLHGNSMLVMDNMSLYISSLSARRYLWSREIFWHLPMTVITLSDFWE